MSRKKSKVEKVEEPLEEVLEEEIVSGTEDVPKKRKKYVTKKSIRLDSLMDAAKEYHFVYKPTLINLKKDVVEVQKMTQGTCLRPDIYLDNDDSCDECHIYQNCVSSIRKLKKKKSK